MQVAISGASGLIGTALSQSLRDDGHQVRRLVRGPSDEPGAIRWDPLGDTIDAAGLEGVDAVVHLAGAGIGDRRWSADHKQAIRDSRTKGTALLARTLAGLERPPKVLVSASGVHFYRGGSDVLTETSAAGEGFLADVVQTWEQATKPAEAAGIRTVLSRNGMVFSRRGGALPPLLRLFRLGLGGRLGSGRQWMSWISLADEVGALRFLLDRDDVAGPVNMTSPNPVTNREFTKALGQAVHRPAVLPAPKFALGLLLGRQMTDELLFTSLRVRPAVLEEAGYRFQHPEIRQAFDAALRDEVAR